MVLFLPPAGRLLMSKFTWNTLSCFHISHQLFTNESKNQLHPRSISTAELVVCNQAEPLPPIICHAIAQNTHHNTALKLKLRSLLIDADDKVKRGIGFEYKRACCWNTEGEIQLRHAGKILNSAMTPPRCAVTMAVGSPVTQTLTVCLRFRQQAGSLSPFFPLECLLGKTNCHCLLLSSDGITWQPVYFLHRNESLAVRRAQGDS